MIPPDPDQILLVPQCFYIRRLPVSSIKYLSPLPCTRGDEPPRVGELTETIWNAILRAGLVVADVSAPNPNVFYEIGLTHGIGKDCFILKQRDVNVPADFGGTHYYEYDYADRNAIRNTLEHEIKEWALKNDVDGVRKIIPLAKKS